MTFPTSALMVVHLMTTLSAVTLSEEIPLTCPDTAGRPLKDISHVYDCTPRFDPEEKLARCAGFFNRDGYLTGFFYARVSLKFKILEEVPEGTAMCLGLQTLSANSLMLEEDISAVVSYDIDFNPLLAVGVLTADHNTSKTNRSYSISLLSDVLNLPVLSQFNVRDSTFWNFSSPLFGTQMNWIQGFKFGDFPTSITRLVLKRLKNTSIKTLNVRMFLQQGSMEILVRDMPFLRVMNFDGVSVNKFHQDSFLGMPQMEVLILHDTYITEIPRMVYRMPKLKRLEIERGSNERRIFIISIKELSTLQNLEVLSLKSNPIYLISRRLPTLLKLRILNLDGCQLSSIEENFFVGVSVLEELTLSNNKLTHLKENTFRPFKRLKLLDLSFNRLTNWPALNDISVLLLDLSHNLLSDIFNLGQNRTTVEILNISNNGILLWDDKYVFSLQKSLIPNDDQRKRLNMIHSEDSNKENISTFGSTKTGHFYKNLRLTTTQRAEISTPLHSGSKTTLQGIPSNRSVVNLYDQTELSKSEKGEKIIVNTFENTIGFSSHWVNTINISYNSISDFSETMVQSLKGIHKVDLGGNSFKCIDCRMIPFQKWLNTTSATVSNLGTSDPLLCSYPVTQKGTPVILVQYDEELCLKIIQTTSLLTVIGVPVAVISIFVAAAGGVIYKFRSKIVDML